MINFRAGGTFIDQNYAKSFEIKLLDQPIIAKNVDGTVDAVTEVQVVQGT